PIKLNLDLEALARQNLVRVCHRAERETAYGLINGSPVRRAACDVSIGDGDGLQRRRFGAFGGRFVRTEYTPLAVLADQVRHLAQHFARAHAISAAAREVSLQLGCA